MSAQTVSVTPGAALVPDIERRRYERRNIYLPLVFTTAEPHARKISGRGTTVNISAGGAFFICREKRLAPGMRLEMVLSPQAALVHDRKMALTAIVLGVYRFMGVNGGHGVELGIAVKFGHLWEFDWPEEVSRARGQ
jgi:hypothetical protein